MENIQNASAQMPGEIRTAVMTILKASPKEVEVYLPGQLEGVRTLAEICSKSALRCETGFNNLTGLLQVNDLHLISRIILLTLNWSSRS